MKKMSFCSWLVAAVCCMSCERAEIPVAAHERGAVTLARVDLDPLYKYQVFFKLRTNSIVRSVKKTDWDLGFEAAASGNHIRLNMSRSMFAFNTGSTRFEDVQDTAGFSASKRWDVPSGNPDSTAIAEIYGPGTVYIIDRGYSETGLHLGFQKMQLLSVNRERYTIRFGDLDGRHDRTTGIPKDERYGMIAFSFDTGQTVAIEPEKNAYDLLFTQYTHIFHEPLQPYLVTGVLQNRAGVRVGIDTTTAFADFTIRDTVRCRFSKDANTIGYEWKYYDFQKNLYIVNPRITYIIQDTEGYYYKLHFIDFYNESGQKGSPVFEFQSL